jgi:pimeloyl-ACP methyl ester carboxylesterase
MDKATGSAARRVPSATSGEVALKLAGWLLMEVRESSLGTFPCLVAGSGPPLVQLAGLAPEAGVSAGSLRHMHESAMRPWAREREVFYVNRRPGLARGMTMAALAAEHAEALRVAFDEPVDLLAASTGGSIAQQLAAEHGCVVRRLALVSTGCRLGPNAKLVQRRIAARVRAGATRQAAAVMAGALAPPALRLPAGCLGWLFGPLSFSVSGLQDMATTIEAEDEFDLARLPPVRAPTLLVGGGRDRFYDRELFEQTARLIPGCALEIHPQRGHITVLSDPRAVAQIRGFLNYDKT